MEPVRRAPLVTPDPWTALGRWTPARIALGRAGGSLPTAALLDFRAAHARAVDAARAPFDAEAFAVGLRVGPPPVAAAVERLGLVCVQSAAGDATCFLRRPDLGRRLEEASRRALRERAGPGAGHDLVVIVADGLSALAVECQAPAVLAALLPALEGWDLAPLIVARHGRVALQDEIGALVGARLALTLIGERPGLGSHDSLGAYLVHGPGPGKTDADRNCVSNIRPDGLPPVQAAARLHALLSRARRLGLSGVGLGVESGPPALPQAEAATGDEASP